MKTTRKTRRKLYCPLCCAHVSDADCPHWDYESDPRYLRDHGPGPEDFDYEAAVLASQEDPS